MEVYVDNILVKKPQSYKPRRTPGDSLQGLEEVSNEIEPTKTYHWHSP